MFSQLLLFLHLVFMFLAVVASVGTATFLRVALMTNQVAAVRGVALVAQRVGPTVPLLFTIGGVFGLATALAFGVDLLAPWLVIAYVGYVLALAVGGIGGQRFGPKLGRAVMASPDGPIPPQLRAVLNDPEYVAGTLVTVLIVLALIWDMVAKPFS